MMMFGKELMQDKRKKNKNAGTVAPVALPPWNALWVREIIF
jgi:hypothetical protein